MKIFILLLILVIAFFYYLFFSDTVNHTSSKSGTSLENIEKEYNQKIDNEVKEYTSLSTQIPTAIPEEQTFDTVKSILKESSGRQYAPNITLNTRINSYLYTINSREDFKQKISSAFNLTYDDVDKSYKKNKLVWDWVNQLKD
jgi:hypothetical protein